MTGPDDADRDALRQSVRAFLNRTPAASQVHSTGHLVDGFDNSTWKALATQLELPGLGIPVEFGGSGFGWSEEAIVFEEFGRALVTMPHFSTVAHATTALLASEDESAKQRFLPAIAAGDLTATVALPAGAPAAVTVRGRVGETTLHGRHSHVVDGGSTGILIVPAVGPQGLALHIVEAGAPGLRRTSTPTMDLTRQQANILLEGCPAQPLRFSDPQAGLAIIETAAALALAWEQIGGARSCLEMAVGHAGQRMQFGRPIGSFQAVRHRCVDMMLDIEAATSLVGHATRTATLRGLADSSTRAQVLAAAAACSEAFNRVAAANVQVHGGIGMTWEHRSHLYLKRAKSSQLLLGHPRQRRASLAAVLRATPDALLPRPTKQSTPAGRRSSRLTSEFEAHIDRLIIDAPPMDLDGGIPFRRAQFDAGLAWPSFPQGLGGLGLDPEHAGTVQRLLSERGVESAQLSNPIGYGNVAPVLIAHGTDEQRRRFLRPCFAVEEVWCQMMSEPDHGSDVAGLSTRARQDGSGGWVISGQKVWTSLAHVARWGLAVVRTDPDVAKHDGITCFVVDMEAPGVDVRPLRLLNGKADFNEVFLNDVGVPDSLRVGEPGRGWGVVRSNLEGERAAFGARTTEPDAGEDLLRWWRGAVTDDAVLADRVMATVTDSLAARLTADRSSRDGLHPAIIKILSSESKQRALEVALDALGVHGTGYAPHGYDMEQPTRVGIMQGDAGARYLRSQGLTIEGGTSLVMRNVLADTVLRLPREPRFDVGMPWRDIPHTVADYEHKAIVR